MSTKRVVVIAGPTASGKSALAIDIAKFLGGVVINADSMQVYQSIPIISACPTLQERAEVEHRLFEIYDCAVRGNVVDWLDHAANEIRHLWAENKIPIVVGGTGLYLDNLINGTTPIPETSPHVRQKIATVLQKDGIAELYRQLSVVDPDMARKLNPNDTTRIVRAMEVFADTGICLSAWYKKPMIKRVPEAEFFVIKICPSAEELDERCYRRFDEMLKQGALAEIEDLNRRQLDQSLPAMKALGVPELLAAVRGECLLAEAVAAAKLHTRQYAKRQRTWFRNKLAADLVLSTCYCHDFTPIKDALLQNGFK